MSALFAPGSLIALALTLLFFVVALQRPQRALLAYAVLGAAPPVLQVGAFSGRTISQGLLLAQTLGTALVAAWLARRPRGRLFHSPFDGPLLVFAAATAVSLVVSIAMPDPSVQDSVNLRVSVGQILLVLWPIGVYLASAEIITSTAQLLALMRVVLVLATLRFLNPFVPDEYRAYTAWMPTFSLFAAPLAMAMFFATERWLARLWLLALVAVPMVDGVVNGKTFLYGSVAAAGVAVLWMRASRLIAVSGCLVAAIVLIGTLAGMDDLFREPLTGLVEMERSQSSFGGRGGRGQLALDALAIWQGAPLFGVGPGNSYLHMLQRSVIGTPHNQYLNILVEFGLVGLIAWCWFLVAVSRTGLRIYGQTTDPAQRTFVLGWLGVFAAMVTGGVTGDYMIHSIRNGGLELFSGYYLQWVLLGGLVAVPRIATAPTLRPEEALPAGGRGRRPGRLLVTPRAGGPRVGGPPEHVAASAVARLWRR
ncbi:MAG: O-antigen ligase family protein [Vicinamibacterales bacterium]